MFTLILASGDYIAPQLLGGTNSMTVGLLISNQFRQTGNWPFGAAMAFISFAIFAVIYVVLTMLLRAGRLAPHRRFH
jgi:spermidine/putrescine transport system permease protein